ncbi:MAG: hypothetical protein ABJH04_19115 [Cyclobacteriaceae bacterium]
MKDLFEIKKLWVIMLAQAACLVACGDETLESIPLRSIFYTLDGSTVKLGDPSPIAVDLNNDEVVDFTVFIELTANKDGDHLYAGINPLRENSIKAELPDDSRFLNMGLLVEEPLDGIIGQELETNQHWSRHYNALVIRHTNNDGSIGYEGFWADSNSGMVGIQLKNEGKDYFGWLRLHFEKATEIITLVDYAVNITENEPVRAGDRD